MDKELQQTVDEVKASGLSVFSIKINSRPFVYRAINRREFRQRNVSLQKQGIESSRSLE